MTYKQKKAAVVAVALACIAVFLFSYRQPQGDATLYFVKRVVDGDTIALANGERVRYIGINTPETKHPNKPVEHFGKEAYQYNKKLVDKKWVRLELDIEKRDRYGRLLAYVYVKDTFVNAKLVEDGYAQVYTFPPNVKHQELFLKLQREARENSLGLWGEE
jgi:micrococcal nuclease